MAWFSAQLVITEPELCKEILNNKGELIRKESPKLVKKLSGDGLVATTKLKNGQNCESWPPMLSMERFKKMVASAETMLERWTVYEGKEIEVYEEFRLFTSEVISRTAFGSSYMSMIINEALRLYPPVVAVIRKVEREVRLGKLMVPSNLELVVSIVALHHDPQIWGQDVQLFKPERFSEGVAKATNNHVGAFIPFGLGPRTCVGLNFGTTEAKIALSMILQRYAFTLSPGYVHLPLRYLTVRPQHGVQVMLQSL
ncbi:cytochrome P450 CYP749A22 [Prunus yedoensis var. nudiflora]|uniref:Cytochrome P450 CYP749A22 n=1 Tax=Prunus yedoensis var. nudiflora TaxID=2094558 RepID=A0A314Y667_PRUYE|nr:cytochrome P450 CYP749A22 [Prunus yedoensis var. nudiflora]